MPDPMHPLFTWTLAQAGLIDTTMGLSRISEVAKNLSSDGLIPTHWLLIAAGALLLLLSGLSIARWWKHHDEYSHPLLVYSGTARLVGLGYLDQWALLVIAHKQSLSSPLTLMLSPGTFDHHVKAYLETRTRWRREAVRRRLNAIRAILFEDHPAAASTHPATA